MIFNEKNTKQIKLYASIGVSVFILGLFAYRFCSNDGEVPEFLKYLVGAVIARWI